MMVFDEARSPSAQSKNSLNPERNKSSYAYRLSFLSKIGWRATYTPRIRSAEASGMFLSAICNYLSTVPARNRLRSLPRTASRFNIFFLPEEAGRGRGKPRFNSPPWSIIRCFM